MEPKTSQQKKLQVFFSHQHTWLSDLYTVHALVQGFCWPLYMPLFKAFVGPCTCPCSRLLLALVQGFCQNLASLVQSYLCFPLPLPLAVFPIRASLYGVSSTTVSSWGFALAFGLAPFTTVFGGSGASDELGSPSLDSSSESSVWVPWSWCCPCSRPEVLLLDPGRQTR